MKKDITVEDLLKHSFVITIDDKRLRWFRKVFKFHGLSPCPKKFQGTTLWYNSGKYNCYLSHKNAILEAKKKNWPYVLIFEDDAYPINGIVGEMQKCLDELPDECQVLSFGTIFLWDVQGEQGNFLRSYKSYGSQAYVVFEEAYDKYIALLDEAPEGDGAFYTRRPDILDKDVFFMPKKNLFIQYNKTGMNNHGGYILIDPGKVSVWDGKFVIPKEASYPKDFVLGLDFPDADEIRTGKRLPPNPNIAGKDDPMTFVTVNCGTNTFTNITLKSILQFHPNAKIFVVDVPKKPEDKFSLIDDDIAGNVEVMKGLMWDELDLPTIRVTETKGLTVEEQLKIVHTFHNKNEIEVLPCGDFQHPMNIQFALDSIKSNLIVIDSDAPMIAPANRIHDSSFVTSAEIEQWNYVHLDRLRPLVRPEILRKRFSPYIQFLNYKMMKRFGVKYFHKRTLKNDLDMAGWFKNPDCDGRESIFFWTGSLFYRAVQKKKLPYKEICSHWYVDHFGGATWQDKGDRHKLFIEKYAHLFKNQEALVDKYA